MPRPEVSDLQQIILTTICRTWQDAEAWCTVLEPYRRGASGEQPEPWRLTAHKGGVCVRGAVWLSCDALRHGMLLDEERV